MLILSPVYTLLLLQQHTLSLPDIISTIIAVNLLLKTGPKLSWRRMNTQHSLSIMTVVVTRAKTEVKVVLCMTSVCVHFHYDTNSSIRQQKVCMREENK